MQVVAGMFVDAGLPDQVFSLILLGQSDQFVFDPLAVGAVCFQVVFKDGGTVFRSAFAVLEFEPEAELGFVLGIW